MAGLLRTLHPDWTYAQIKDQILATVDPLPSLAGKSVTGGRLNAANALGVVQDPRPPSSTSSTTRTPNRTYEYGRGGERRRELRLDSGNTAPRGAASTAAGDKVWVVDANKKVYVYNTSGGLLGSWTAGSLAANATVEGIATNGTDIWIVDAKQDKVFRYTGAASRLSGSQNAASSFNLNSGNSNPKDIVTDGTSLVGRQRQQHRQGVQVHARRLAPRKLDDHVRRRQSDRASRIDPANVSDIWIVDSGTDRVYQYTAAASPHLRQPVARHELRPGRRQHQPAGHRRPAELSVRKEEVTPRSTRVLRR